MELELGSFVDMGTLYWCRECQGHSTGELRCSACHEPRLKTRKGTGYKRIRNKPPFPLLGGVYFTGRVIKGHWNGFWKIMSVWETENGGRLFYPACCAIEEGRFFCYAFNPYDKGVQDYFAVMDYLGEYLANIDILDPTWRRVDVVNGEVLDTTDYELRGWCSTELNPKSQRIKDMEDNIPF